MDQSLGSEANRLAASQEIRLLHKIAEEHRCHLHRGVSLKANT